MAACILSATACTLKVAETMEINKLTEKAIQKAKPRDKDSGNHPQQLHFAYWLVEYQRDYITHTVPDGDRKMYWGSRPSAAGIPGRSVG